MGNFKIESNNFVLSYCTLRSTIKYPNIFWKKLNNGIFCLGCRWGENYFGTLCILPTKLIKLTLKPNKTCVYRHIVFLLYYTRKETIPTNYC